jgi:hypothetical protein
VKGEYANTSQKAYNTINLVQVHYTLGLSLSITKGEAPKDASNDNLEFVEAISLTVSTFSSP